MMLHCLTLFIFVTLIFSIFLLNTIIFNDDFSIKSFLDKKSKTSDNILFDYCNLPQLDPWDNSILPFLKPETNPLNNCIPKIKQRSFIENGKLYLLEIRKNSRCFYRCLLPGDDNNFHIGSWITVVNGSDVECDIVEVKCEKRRKVFYEFLHATVVTQKKFAADFDAADKAPDVHILLFDSVSRSQIIRAMPKTLKVLQSDYDSVMFNYLNKVGLNSHPNGFALFMGKSITSIPKSPLSNGHRSDYVNDSYRNNFLDDDQFIGFAFNLSNYVIAMSEDWAKGVFNSYQAQGFSKPPTHHYMKPFQLRIEAHKNYLKSKLDKIIHEYSCKEPFQYQMDYLQSFIDAYPNQPKFSITWMTDIAHEDGNKLYHVDEYFYKFFKKNQQKLKNSFVLILADHGNRFGKIRETDIGEKEDNNPAFILLVPEKQRKEKNVMDLLNFNSRQLITHSDIYATLIDIAKAKKSKDLILKGSSLLQPLPFPRTCDRLGIPFEYCICNFSKLKRFFTNKQSNNIGKEGAELMIQKMNEALNSDFQTKFFCATLKLNQNVPILIEEFFETKEETKVYQIFFSTLPGNGSFSGYLSQNSDDGKIEVITEKFPRLNKYSAQAKCASKSNFAVYCYCKNFIPLKNSEDE